jgi:Short C-terminal domain
MRLPYPTLFFAKTSSRRQMPHIGLIELQLTVVSNFPKLLKLNADEVLAKDKLPFDERLRRLQKLRDEGLVSEQEYESTKKKILESA